MPCFRTGSSSRSRRQAPLCHCTLQVISNHPEGTFGRLRYLLGGDRPSQTTHLTLSFPQVRAPEMEGWYSTVGFRLPPILYIHLQNPMSGCSKAPRGLSVLSWVTGIFTGITISPSLSLRQRSSRYAFRAGRNLPDKEFRYLRTVIVTAAIHQGFRSGLRLSANPSH
jgi:hypothetical protein